MISAWLPQHVAQIGDGRPYWAPVITRGDVAAMIPDLDLWDMWPLALRNGETAQIDGAQLWMILSAPKHEDPDRRHDFARIRLIFGRHGDWRDCGDLLPDGFAPGSREWSGSAIYDPVTQSVTLFFTAAGRPQNPDRRFEQRLFQATGTLDMSGPHPKITDWSDLAESFASDGVDYAQTEQAPPTPGMIKGFRDPGFFEDPADGAAYILFTGSLQGSAHSHNGVVGLAKAQDVGLTRWRLMPPILQADGLCNEMERPHIIHRAGLYYLFWSSQSAVFASDGPVGPTGLYGMVAPDILGPYRPLNGSGLVIANPAQAPVQAYCWWVTPDLSVTSFVDKWGPEGQRRFGGVLAPTLHLKLDGDTAVLAKSPATASAAA